MKRKNKKTQKSRKKRTQAIQYAMHQPSLTPPANRLYKDRLFHMLFSDKAALLSLYNALNGTHYDNPEDLIITTLENAIYMGMHNDVSCILFSEINLYEQQASICPNIALKQYMEFVTKVRECIDILTSKTIDNPLPYTDRLRIAISEAVDYCIAHNILGDFLKKHRSEVIAVTLYEYSEEEHRRIQERDKAELKEQLAEAETNLRQSEIKLSQAIHNTIAMLQNMGCDDAFICSKLCDVYQLSEAEALFYLEKK